MLFAPWLDLTLTDPAIRDVEKRDVMLPVDTLRMSGEWWAGGEDARQPWLSPFYGDLTQLSPIDIFQGTDDIFIVDARAFYQRALALGADVQLYETPGGFHVFMGALWIPEAQDVFRQVGRNLNQESRL